jgi:adenylate cyclase
MPRNVEIKARIADAATLARKAEAIADREPQVIIQDDTFFPCRTGRLKLRVFSPTAGELIFYRRPDQTGPKESFYVIAATSAPDAMRAALTLAYGQCGHAYTWMKSSHSGASSSWKWCSKTTKRRRPASQWLMR